MSRVYPPTVDPDDGAGVVFGASLGAGDVIGAGLGAEDGFGASLGAGDGAHP